MDDEMSAWARRLQAGSSVRIMDGAQLAARRQDDLHRRALAVRARLGRTPRLAILAFAEPTGPAPYVARKVSACAAVGVDVVQHHVPFGADSATARQAMDALVTSHELDGLFVQVPYPDASFAAALEHAIPERLDVDVMSPGMVQRYLHDEGVPPPVTVSAVLALLSAYRIDVRGRRGLIVADAHDFSHMLWTAIARLGVSLAPLVSPTDPTLVQHVREAELVVIAAAAPGTLRVSELPVGSVAIDVGYFNPGGRGDLDLSGGVAHLAAIVPVPGGIGPMTISCLVERVILHAEMRD